VIIGLLGGAIAEKADIPFIGETRIGTLLTSWNNCAPGSLK